MPFRRISEYASDRVFDGKRPLSDDRAARLLAAAIRRTWPPQPALKDYINRTFFANEKDAIAAAKAYGPCLSYGILRSPDPYDTTYFIVSIHKTHTSWGYL